MSLNTRFRLACASITVVTALGVTATACSSVSKPHYAPTGSENGTYGYCAYTAVEDGIKIDEDQSVPCLVTDVREADDRTGKSKAPLTKPKSRTAKPKPKRS